jgi:hypothetical protein
MGVWANSNVSSNKCVTIMALKPNQLQVTTIHAQANAIIDIITSFDLKNENNNENLEEQEDILRSFDLENNHENLEEQEDNPFDYFLQSTAWSSCY